ncbi:hypothetical protein [Pelomonas cellulosilytica]|uniref:Lipoprotein n=1 Tax=Pelomonas cellulosilytica TaxID=2906762 RepID=A0ABS8XWR7_9BURK|nr:hypothetical protein [Pelomonas sp. P8]MCE4557104.1 hypothetical protein [Pelomonas sp. P8]
MKRMTLAVCLVSAALLSGCIIVPGHRHCAGLGDDGGPRCGRTVYDMPGRGPR